MTLLQDMMKIVAINGFNVIVFMATIYTSLVIFLSVNTEIANGVYCPQVCTLLFVAALYQQPYQ